MIGFRILNTFKKWEQSPEIQAVNTDGYSWVAEQLGVPRDEVKMALVAYIYGCGRKHTIDTEVLDHDKIQNIIRQYFAPTNQ